MYVVDECHHDYNLDKVVVAKDIRNVPTIEICLSQCMMEKEFICRSVDYRSSIHTCYMNVKDRYAVPDKYKINAGYHHCTVGKKSFVKYFCGLYYKNLR